jgi:hypothetical protein
VGEISFIDPEDENPPANGYTFNPDNPQDSFSSLTYYNVYMNVDVTSFMGPAVEEVQKYTKPLQPVVDTLTAPLPVISDLSTLVGQDPVSLMSIMAAAPSNKLTMITRLAEMISFANNIPAEPSGIWIGLGEGDEGSENEAGSFDINIETVVKPVCGEEKEVSKNKTTQTCESDGKLEKINKQTWNKGTDKEKTLESKYSGEVGWDGAGITMPILSDTSQIYGMLLGVDATLIRVDLGTLSASAGLEYSYGPFLVGPVPVSISIGGSVTLEGRFAIGFDTRGLRSTLRGEARSA